VRARTKSADRGAAKPLGRRTISWREVETPSGPIQSTTAWTVVTLTLAVVLAAGIVFLLAELVPQLVDLMMPPPPLSGAR